MPIPTRTRVNPHPTGQLDHTLASHRCGPSSIPGLGRGRMCEKVSSVTCRRSVVSSGCSGFLHQKTDFIIISPPWYDPGCCWGVKPLNQKTNQKKNPRTLTNSQPGPDQHTRLPRLVPAPGAGAGQCWCHVKLGLEFTTLWDHHRHSKNIGSVDLISTCVKIAFVKARLQSLDFYVESCSRNRKTATRWGNKNM